MEHKPNLAQLFLEAAAGRRPGDPSREDKGQSRGGVEDRQAKSWPPTLDEVLKEVPPLPAPSLLLGLGEDGLPWQMDLTNASSGSLLVLGDEHAGLTKFLRGMLTSAALINPAESLEFSIITSDVEEFLDFARFEHCQEIFSEQETVLSELIIEFNGMVKGRRRTGEVQPSILLVLHNLLAILERLSHEGYTALYTLIRHGPRYRIWTVAALYSQPLSEATLRFLDAFRTTIVGHCDQKEAAELLAPGLSSRCRSLDEGQFLVPIHADWSSLWVFGEHEANTGSRFDNS